MSLRFETRIFISQSFNMVTIIDFETRMNADGNPYVALILQGDVQLVQSKDSGKFYATARKLAVPSTFEASTAKSLIGSTIPGQILKERCEEYEYTNPSTGEVRMMNYRYVYKEQEPVVAQSFPSVQLSQNGALVH